MLSLHSLARQLGCCAAVLATILAPLASGAQAVPSYARPSYAAADETIAGRIRSVDGAFALSVDDDRGFIDTVELHAGTIINPTGLTLSPGMSVTILGVNAGPVFSANEIDTPYAYDGPLPTPVYFGPGYWYPGFAYGYGPAFGLTVIFGGGYGRWSFEHHRFSGRPWNGHAYFGGPVGGVRRELGRAFDARPARAAALAPNAFAGRSFAGGYARGSSAAFSGRGGGGAHGHGGGGRGR
jgi:hypothetical protein